MAERVWKEVDTLQISDFSVYPVWEFNLGDSDMSDTAMTPVLDYPVSSLGNEVVGTVLVLANGTKVFGVIGNVRVRDPERTKEFLTVSFLTNAGSFYLRRDCDPPGDSDGPVELAEFLSIPLEHIFPITYDISAFCVGDEASLVGTISRKP